MRLLSAIAQLAFIAAPNLVAYTRQTIVDATGAAIPTRRTDNTRIQFYVNSRITPGFQSTTGGAAVTVFSPGSDPFSAIQAAASTWNALSTAKVHFLPLKTTDKINDPADFQMTISVGSTAADLSFLGYSSPSNPGAGAVTITQSVSGAGLLNGVNVAPGDIADSDIILNPAIPFSTDGSTRVDLQAIMTHEFGHALGAGHSGLIGASMFQVASWVSSRNPAADEISFLNAAYPNPAFAMGTISGKVTGTDGAPVQYGLLTLIDSASGNTVGGLTGADGTYSLQVPPATYILYAEPMAPGNIVQPANLYIPPSAKVSTNFETTVLGGPGSPTPLAVAAGTTTAAPDLIANSGANVLRQPFIGTGKAGGTGGISAFNIMPQVLISGRSVDIGLTGGGIDGTSTVEVLGQGISVHPGSLRVDGTLVRVTLDVAARQGTSLASLLITKGQNTVVLSGVLAIVPPKPLFTSSSIVSAASYKGGGVSPGGIYSIYDVATATLGPTAFAKPEGYDAEGKLPTRLGGVTVTFDGVPAPLYLSYAGQLNLQVPFEIAGKTSTTVVVNFLGSQSDPVTLPVVPAQPAFFTFTPLGPDAIIQNFPDYSLNNANNPIARAGTVLVYGTGIGKQSYALETGQPGVAPPASYTSTYACSFGGKSSSAYAYWNYGFVGEALWVAAIPSDAPTGPVSVTCTDSLTGASTQQGTIYIK